MSVCEDRHRLLVRLADDGSADPLTERERDELETHIAQCAGCRAAIDEQRLVAGILRARPPVSVSPAFAARLSARLDEVSGWLGMLDWRAWTFRLAPVALALAIAALFAGTAATSDASTATLDAWTRGVAESASAASAVWHDSTSSDALLETMVIGSNGGAGNNNVR